MNIPEAASKVVIHYGEVYIESPAYPDDTRGAWTVWDPRPVRQGARLMFSGLTFREAETKAKALTTVTKGRM